MKQRYKKLKIIHIFKKCILVESKIKAPSLLQILITAGNIFSTFEDPITCYQYRTCVN